jgi:hypothetical protein
MSLNLILHDVRESISEYILLRELSASARENHCLKMSLRKQNLAGYQH